MIPLAGAGPSSVRVRSTGGLLRSRGTSRRRSDIPGLGGAAETPVVFVVDPLFAHGIVPLSNDASIIVCVVDGCGIGNEAHDRLRKVLAAGQETAKAMKTTSERAACSGSVRFISMIGRQGICMPSGFFR